MTSLKMTEDNPRIAANMLFDKHYDDLTVYEQDFVIGVLSRVEALTDKQANLINKLFNRHFNSRKAISKRKKALESEAKRRS